MMVEIMNVGVEDLEQLLDCERSVWESFRGILPDEFLEEELRRFESEEVKESMMRFLKDPNAIVLVAKEEGQVVGFARGSVRAGVSHLGLIGVRVEWRKRGVGSSLLKEYIERSKQKRAHKVCLLTSVNLEPAIRLYVKAGFVPEGFLRRHYYGVDMIFYSKFLE